MSIFKSFVPFIAYSVVANWFDWQLGIALGLVALIAVVLTTPSRHLGVLGLAQLSFLTVAGIYAVVRLLTFAINFTNGDPDRAVAAATAPPATHNELSTAR